MIGLLFCYHEFNIFVCDRVCLFYPKTYYLNTTNLIGHVHHCQAVGQFKFKGFQDAMNVWELLEPKSESMQQTDWVNFNLPGFNLHLNFHDIRNYDKNDITNQLKSALALVEEKQK